MNTNQFLYLPSLILQYEQPHLEISEFLVIKEIANKIHEQEQLVEKIDFASFYTALQPSRGIDSKKSFVIKNRNVTKHMLLPFLTL